MSHPNPQEETGETPRQNSDQVSLATRPENYRSTSDAVGFGTRQQGEMFDRRSQLERVWSTSVLQPGEAENSFAGSWTSGFGIGDEFNNSASTAAAAGFGSSWTATATTITAVAGEDIERNRRSSMATIERGPSQKDVAAPFSRSATVAVGDRSRAAVAVTTQIDAETGERSWISSRIHDAARITDWTRVKQLCAQNPEDARYASPDGWTALHHVCNRRCPDVEAAEAVIRACPDALIMQDNKGFTPLHYACRFSK